MAFCTNCGKSLQGEARFCTNCGSPVQAAAPVSATTPSVPSAAVPAAAPLPEPAVPPYQTGEVQPEVAAEPPVPTGETSSPAPYGDVSIASQSSTSPTFVIVCVVLLVLIAGGIAGTVYLQRQGKAKAAAAQQTSADTSQPGETPSSNLSSASSSPVAASSPATSAPTPPTSGPTTAATTPEPATAAAPASAPVADSIRAMNLGNYPGATPVAIATLTGETVVAGFLTPDTPQQVMQFYKIRFPLSTMTQSDGKAELSATLPGGERIRIQAQPQGTSTQVMVLQEN